MKIIDAHIHIGKKSFCDLEQNSFNYDLCVSYDEVIKMMNYNGINKAVVLPVPHVDFCSEVSNNYVFEAYQKYPDRLIPFCRIDEHLEENLKKGFKGVKLHLVYENYEIKKIKKELQIIEDLNVPLIVHARFSDKVGQIEEIFKYAPNLVVILAHMGRGNIYTGHQVVENAIKLKKFENLYMDCSTVGDIKAIVNVCEILGYNRVIFATDYPFGKNYYGDVYSYSNELTEITKCLNGNNRDLILYKNIEYILNIKKDTYIRRAKKSDLDSIMDIFENLSEIEKSFLAYNKKRTLIRQIIRSERHCYVAIFEDKIVGFLRESGRQQGYSLLEEIVVSPNYRGKGIAKKLLSHYHRIFKKNIAKTNSSNKIMINLLNKYDYIPKNPEAPRIINWIRCGE